MIPLTKPINVQTLTPVHIGNGHEMRGNYEYVYFFEEQCIAVIDLEKVLQIIGIENIDHWVAAIDQGLNIRQHIPQLRKVKAVDIAQRMIGIHRKAPLTERNSIKAQIHLGQRQATIPGSSLKGAIRTAILTHLIKEESGFASDSQHLGSRRNEYFNYHARQIEAFYLGHADRPNRAGELEPSPNHDLLRFLRIGDAYFDDPTCVVKNTIVNLFNHGWGQKKEESSFFECIPAEVYAKASIQIPAPQIEQVQKRQSFLRIQDYKTLELLELPRLFELINQHTRRLIQNEIDFWEDEDNPIAIGDYLECLDRIIGQIDSAGVNTCVLRVGAGSGWDFMTGAWTAGVDYEGGDILSQQEWVRLKRQLRRGKNYPDNVLFPKTRKMIEGGEPMGFVQLSLIK